jgi:hypothetical protein
MNGACARAPCVVLAHADFIVDCIVLGLLEMHFWSFLVHGLTNSCLNMLDYCNHLQTKIM